MIRESITVDEVLEVLNRMVAEDADAAARLVAARVTCNEALAGDPTIQVGHVEDDPLAPFEVGFLGVLNGLFGISETGFGVISAVYDVVCPDDCGGNEELRVGDACPKCGGILVLGAFRRFSRTPNKYLHRQTDEAIQ